MKIRITSENNFATASGLASSSSGLSCLSFALAKLYGVKEEFEGEYSKFARMGSGSACRSLYGGFV
jgi:diphosphomevalonate decarboxylase